MVFALTFAWWLCCLPRPLFQSPLATELLSAEGELLSARISADGQWRMPAADSISPKLIAAVINYEDRTFRSHWGLSFWGISRAVRDNWRAGRVVSGGSTITMQVARMARGNRARTLVQKLLEGAWATRLEWRYDKDEILKFWLANAPFGGNVVGAEAATRRYYGRSPAALSWAEAATLAVLPNSPALIHPGRDRKALRAKRDNLLDDLATAGHLSAADAGLAKLEPLPKSPLPLPRRSDHLLERLRANHGPGRYRSSLRFDLQNEVNSLVSNHHALLAGNQVRNLAAMVTEVATGKVVAYVGNVPAPASAPKKSSPAALNGREVDIITAPRSPGSLLKPVLFALAQEDGRLTPRQLLTDIPTRFQDFQPANFYPDFDGAVPANEALARSLNIPFVFLLQDYGVPRMHAALLSYGFRQLHRPPSHYGLSLILGGGEITMEEINAWFLGLARQQRYYYARRRRYQDADFKPAGLLDGHSRDPIRELNSRPGAVGAGAGYQTLEALTQLNRPDETGKAHQFESHRRIAWKTGTSFGHRDAWAVGCTPAYVVSVWAGNADGEGRAGLVGVRAAAPLFFRIFRLLEGRGNGAPVWFAPPRDDMAKVTTCRQSGLLAGPDCPPVSEWVAAAGARSKVCNRHRLIFIDPEERQRVRLGCGEGPPKPVAWFTLPSRQAHFYQRRHPDYQPLPPVHPACTSGVSAVRPPMEFIYPYENGVVSASKNWDGETEPFFFELAHSDKSATVRWHLDEDYLAETRIFHSVSVHVPSGIHRVTVVDQDGNRLEKRFEVN